MPDEKVIVVKLLKYYYFELAFLCTEIKANCERVFEATPDRGEPFFDVFWWIHSCIGHSLTAAANVKKLLDDRRPRNKRFENQKSYELRLVRAKMLQEQLAGIDLRPIQDSQVRNTLEHFDENLDMENVVLRDQTIISGALYNVAMTKRDMVRVEMNAPILHIRTYESSTRKFIHLGGEIDMEDLRDGCCDSRPPEGEEVD